MSVITNEYLRYENPVEMTATYSIEIQNFRKKLRKAKKGKKVTTKKFFVNWSEFSIDIYIAGITQTDGNHLSLYLVNHSDWMVRASFALYVKGVIFNSGNQINVYKPGDAYICERAYGLPNFVPLCRCYNNDLLSHDGILALDLRVDVFAENTLRGGGGIQKQLSTLNKTQEQLSVVREEVSRLKRKLADQDTEISDLKSKIRKVEMKKEIKTEIYY